METPAALSTRVPGPLRAELLTLTHLRDAKQRGGGGGGGGGGGQGRGRQEREVQGGGGKRGGGGGGGVVGERTQI